MHAPSLRLLSAAPLALLIAIILTPVAHAADNEPGASAAATAEVEEIYVLRSVREKREGPGAICVRGRDTGKLTDPAWEDSYTFRAVTTEAQSGRILEAEAKRAGTIHACFGKTADATVLDLYGEAVINGIKANAAGKCRTAKTNFPEPGVNLFGCLFELYDLPPGYSGGQLTTNSVSTSELFGTMSKPEGYIQVSIATVRLWRKRG